ncbi:hypothetical protein A1OO_09505 [Enterovibrio norvegicus FF-33]|uniref:Lipoprotein n=1 Tax=Enterovibrio norvegicus FF-454 TaxID=1185651 RepID=A0A1E5BXY8_9GAMM|nr:hypothetical protein [Enterovibrio norvegicus]OEE58164.1 hypothetical protein A1OK_16505 [Enterovibrio norvegicus FF-454]OEE66029.1 hypothetical protein A1OO_09505 [Enterovibrio norvegicus FF-33]
MKKTSMVLMLILALSGCDLAKHVQEMSQKQAKLERLIQSNYGWKAQVGWNIRNDVLQQVTVNVSASDVGSQTISSLEEQVNKSLRTVFEEQPETVVLQVVLSLEK